MPQDSRWLGTYSALLVAAFTLAAAAYATVVYQPCWQAAGGTSDPTRSWSPASPALIYHAIVISCLVALALCSAAPVLQSAIDVFAGTFPIVTTKWWNWGLGFIGVSILAVGLQAARYAQGVRAFLAVAGGSDTPPFFFWYRELMCFLAPLAAFSAALSIDYRAGHFKHALESLSLSAMGTFFVLSHLNRMLRSALAPTVLAGAFVLLFLHLREVRPGPFRFPNWLASRWESDA